MTSQSLTLHHQTRLVVNVIIEDDTGALAYSILLITTLFTLLRQVSRFMATTKCELSLLVTDLKAACDFTTKVLAIGFNALTYGLGITI
jgi:hypothetical protein